MERDLQEVLASQEKMLARLSPERRRADADDRAALERAFARQLRQVRIWLARRENVRTCFVRHADTIADPRATARVVAAFLGETHAPDASRLDARLEARLDEMAAAVDASLHRQRRAPPG